MRRWKGTNYQFSKNLCHSEYMLANGNVHVGSHANGSQKLLCTPLYAQLHFWAFHSPTAVTHPGMLLNGVGTPSLTTMISHWKQVPTVTSWLFTVRVDSLTPPRAIKGPVVIVGAIVRLVIEASPVTSQFGRKEVLLNWHVTVNMTGTGWFSQKDTFCGLLLYPTRCKHAHTDFQ